MKDLTLPADRVGPPVALAPVGPSHLSANDSLGSALEPALVRACHHRLTDIRWFRTTWQRGGASTAYATYTDSAEQAHAVVVKLPVPPQELLWLERLQAHNHGRGDVVPRLLAHAQAINGYDLAWVVMERLPHGPLSHHWNGAEFDLLIAATGRWYAAAQRFPVDRPPRSEDWGAVLNRARQAVHDNDLANRQRWSKALKHMRRKMPAILRAWNARQVDHWCHGDLHLANAMTRHPAPDGPAVLFDLAEIHAGHWTEDAVYLEHLYWSRPQRLGGRDLVKLLAHTRKTHHLPPTPDWPHLANLRRVLLAASAPAYMDQEGQLPHLNAALEVLEHTLTQL